MLLFAFMRYTYTIDYQINFLMSFTNELSDHHTELIWHTVELSVCHNKLIDVTVTSSACHTKLICHTGTLSARNTKLICYTNEPSMNHTKLIWHTFEFSDQNDASMSIFAVSLCNINGVFCSVNQPAPSITHFREEYFTFDCIIFFVEHRDDWFRTVCEHYCTSSADDFGHDTERRNLPLLSRFRRALHRIGAPFCALSSSFYPRRRTYHIIYSVFHVASGSLYSISRDLNSHHEAFCAVIGALQLRLQHFLLRLQRCLPCNRTPAPPTLAQNAP